MKAKPSRVYSETEILFVSAGYPIRDAAINRPTRREMAEPGKHAARRLAIVPLAPLVARLSRLANACCGRLLGSHPGV